MRWLPWLLGIVGVLQFGIMALVKPDSAYVTLDTAYLVMWLAIIGGVLTWYLSCWGECGYGGGCGCCGDGCSCGDCEECGGHEGKGHGNPGHEGHGHDGGHQH